MSGSWYQRRSTRQLWGVQRHLQRGMILSNVYWMSSHVQIYLGQTLKLKISTFYLYLIVTISVVLFVLHLCVKTEEKINVKSKKQLLAFSLCCTFVQRTEGKFVNRVPLQRNLLPVSSEREINWRLKKTLLLFSGIFTFCEENFDLNFYKDCKFKCAPIKFAVEKENKGKVRGTWIPLQRKKSDTI